MMKNANQKGTSATENFHMNTPLKVWKYLTEVDLLSSGKVML